MKALHLAVLALFSSAVFAQPAETVRRRGRIEKEDASSVVIKERNGEMMTLALADNLAVNEVLPLDPQAIQSGKFVGTAAMPASDGSPAALEVLVFPEAARGTGEGHSTWDLQPGSTMTNATVTAVTPGAKGRSMTLRYKDGEKPT